jgi:hypothetical protein
MFLTCITNRSVDLASNQRPRGETDGTVYPLNIGSTYAVLGMGLWEHILTVLVRDEYGYPCFAPAGLFAAGTSPIPESWSFGLFSGIRASGTDVWTDPRGAVWGYFELVNDEDHAGALGEHQPDALAIFVDRAHQADALREQ